MGSTRLSQTLKLKGDKKKTNSSVFWLTRLVKSQTMGNNSTAAQILFTKMILKVNSVSLKGIVKENMKLSPS